MKIYKALKNSMLGQGFDCNPWMKEFYANVGMTNHGGYDWGATTGQVVWYDCDVPGFVLNTETDCYGGLGINIITENEDGVFKHRFWHLKDFLVKAGDKVEMGDAIGLADNTGMSTGTHLHRDIKEMENMGGWYKIKYPDNGTFGTIRIDDKIVYKFVLDELPKDLANRKQILMILKIIMKRLKVA